MTLCIGGPLHGQQAPLSCEDMPSFHAPIPLRTPTVAELRKSQPMTVPSDTVAATYVRRPIDIFVGGTSVPAYVYATDNLNGREIAARIAAVLGNAGRRA